MFVQTNGLQLRILQAYLLGLGGSMPLIKLFKNNITPSRNSVAGDFTEADFTGYADVAVTGFTNQTTPGQGGALAYSLPLAEFNSSGSTIGNTIYGYYIIDGGMGAVLLGAERFSSPISMVDAPDQIVISFPFGIRDAGIPGQVF